VKVAVIGLGYIGLPTALLIAANGNKVVGVDIDSIKVEKLNKGSLPFKEKGLDELFQKAKDNFVATNSFDKIKNADAIIVCVPTPIRSKKMDDKYVVSAMTEVGKRLKKGQLVVLESTVTPGTTERKVKNILERESRLICCEDFYLAYCPERAIPGNTIYEMIHNDRPIGGVDRESALRASRLYSTFVKGNLILTRATIAEMAKVAENSYRDVNIALANELAKIAEKVGVNVFDVINVANKHPRVNIHTPGIGVGGHCLPLDPWFLVEVYPKAEIIPLARKINKSMVDRVINKLEKEGSKNVLIFGEAYKPDVDDTRESPSLDLYNKLTKKGFNARIYDPVVRESDDLNEKLESVDTIIIATAHSIFKTLDWEDIVNKLKPPKLVVDGRYFFREPPHGAKFYGIGRGDVN